MARGCRHHDSQWFSSLFPVGSLVTEHRPDALRARPLLAPAAPPARWVLERCWNFNPDVESMHCAAALGYAPAEVHMSRELQWSDPDEARALLVKAAAQGDREGLYALGEAHWTGHLCEQSRAKALALYEEAVELGHGHSQVLVGLLKYGEFDWQRYHWWRRAAARGWHEYQFQERPWQA